MELAIDTSTRFASVGVADKGEVVAEMTWRSGRNHSVELVPGIRHVIGLAGTDVDRLDAVYVAAGPGGFSALRVGMSTAKGMAAALDVPLVAVPTLDVEAEPYLYLGKDVHAVIGAGRTRRYLGTYVQEQEPEYSVVEDEELASKVSTDSLFCGEGLPQVADLLRSKFGAGVILAGATPPTRRSGTLAMLAYRRLQDGRTDDPRSLQPLYLRSTQVETAERAWSGKQ